VARAEPGPYGAYGTVGIFLVGDSLATGILVVGDSLATGIFVVDDSLATGIFRVGGSDFAGLPADVPT
jgi:hypothetical protein